MIFVKILTGVECGYSAEQHLAWLLQSYVHLN